MTTFLFPLFAGAGELPGADRLPTIAELPDPFRMKSGQRVASREDWARRRKEIREIVLHYEYGHPPDPPGNVRGQLLSTRPILEGVAREEEVQITCGPEEAIRFHVYLTFPANPPAPLPVIIRGDRCWQPVAEPIVRMAVARGYMLADFDRTELDGDNADRTDGVHPLYPGHDWGTLAAWAWGYHRVVDYLLTRPDVDPRYIAATGHSRGGKTALLAGALDERITLVNPNDSGCGGAGSFRMQGEGSESLKAIVTRFPYWFHPRLAEFIGREERLPFDQHFLFALVAPRALLSTNALGDLWANPVGSQRVYLAAKEVYRFLGAPEQVGIWFREGPHAHNEQDWSALLDFADSRFFGKPVETRFHTLAFPEAEKGFSWKAP